jgi:hypothetical protein
MRRTHALLMAAVVALLLAGCGSSAKSSSTGGSSANVASAPLSASAWKQKINSICSSMTQKSNALTKPAGPSDLSPFIQKIVAYGNDEVAQIKAVTPPAQFAAGQQKVVGDLTAIWGAFGSLLGRHLSGTDLAKAANRLPSKILAPAKDYIARTRAAGLSSCVLNTGA